MQWFFYGTLLDPDIRRLVFPHAHEGVSLEPALLPGFRRVRCKGALYPVLTPAKGQRVPGLVCRGLDERAVLRMAHFEGTQYRPEALEVRLPSGDKQRAWLFMPRHGGFATREAWTYERWLRTTKPRIMHKVHFWMNQCGVETMGSPEILWHVRRQIRAIARTAERPAPAWRLAA